jgi:hypothetical protein
MNEQQLWEWIMDGGYPSSSNNIEQRRATAVLKRTITVKKWQGHGKEDIVETWPAGKKVKVVMASRFGDVGITDDLNANNGYHYRTQCVDKPNDLLTEITPVTV